MRKLISVQKIQALTVKIFVLHTYFDAPVHGLCFPFAHVLLTR